MYGGMADYNHVIALLTMTNRHSEEWNDEESQKQL